MESSIATVDYREARTDLTTHRAPLGALTGIRFLAAAYVVVYHTKLSPALTAHGDKFAGNFCMSGYLAVSLFFLLSGFILAYTYAGQIDQPGAYRRFWEARFARIWPVYVVSLLLTSAATSTVPKVSYMFATLLMVQAWNPFDRGMWAAWNYVCWTLSVEAFFYLCFPQYQSWADKVSSRLQLISVGVMLALSIWMNSGAFVIGYTSHGILDSIPLPLIRLPEFLTGVGLGNYFLSTSGGIRKHSTLQRPFGGLVTYSSALISIALLCTGRGPWTSLVIAAFAVLIFGLATENTVISRLLSTKGMIFGGGISYSIYLFQAPVKDAVLNFSDRFSLHSAAIKTSFMAISLLILSFLTFSFVEIPARQKLRAVSARMEAWRANPARRAEMQR